MKNKIIDLVQNKIEELNIHIDDSFIEEVEQKQVLNIVLDSEKILNLEKVTEASKIINKLLDDEQNIIKNIDEVDIYSKEKGEENEQ